MDYIGKATTLKVGDKTYTLSRLTRARLKEFAEWVTSQMPDPLDTAANVIGKFTDPDMKKFLLQRAWEDARSKLDPDSPEVRSWMNSLDGQVKLLEILLREHHPGISADEVFDVAVRYGEEHPDDPFRDPAPAEVRGADAPNVDGRPRDSVRLEEVGASTKADAT